MRQDIAKQWAAELRSGKWKQATNGLCDQIGHCCLGVLCEIAIKHGVGVDVRVLQSGAKAFDYAISAPPRSVRMWAALRTPLGYYSAGAPTLAELNDSGTPFSEIADIIEANADKL